MKKFDINTKGNDYFVGDLHGCYDQFVDKLAEIDFEPETDRMFCVGDLVDRGPNSPSCLALLSEPWFHCVRGNHEELMLGSHSYHVWMMNGGGWSEDIESGRLRKFGELVVEKCPYTIEVKTSLGTIGVVHAESHNDWNENGRYYDKEKNTWGRSKIRTMDDTPIKNIDRVVVGHTIVKEPVRLGNVVYIDTGAYNGYDLTVFTVDDVFNKKLTTITKEGINYK